MDEKLFNSLKPKLAEHILAWLDEHCPIGRNHALEISFRVKHRPLVQIDLKPETEIEASPNIQAPQIQVPLETNLRDLVWSGRGRTAICEKMITVGQLTRLTENDLYDFKNFGAGTMQSVKGFLSLNGLRLGMEIPPSEKEIEVIRAFPTESFLDYPQCQFKLELKFPTLGELADADDELIRKHIEDALSRTDKLNCRTEYSVDEVLDKYRAQMEYVLDTLETYSGKK